MTSSRRLIGARRRRPGRIGPAERWQRFARSLHDRYGRAAARPRGLVLLLVRPFAPIVIHSHRWLTAAHTLAPRIHLSFVSPALATPVWSRSTAAGSPNANGTSRPALPGRRGERVGVSPSAWFGTGAPAAPGPWLRRPEGKVFPVGSPWRTEASPAAGGWSASTLVFARDRGAEAYTDAPPLRRREIPMLEEGAPILRRAVDGRRRMEEEVQRRLVPRLPQGPAERGSGSPSPEAPTMPSARSRPTAEPRVPPSPLPITLDQLTEQVVRKIDQRITAYRERLGRA
jgi:hypothetical protein